MAIDSGYARVVQHGDVSMTVNLVMGRYTGFE